MAVIIPQQNAYVPQTAGVNTSGTVGMTVIDTAALLEHAMRRAGVPAEKQTPEIVQAATESMYMLLLGLANDGLNLWCVERDLLGVTQGQATYVLPIGTLDVVTMAYTIVSQAAATLAQTTAVVTTATLTGGATTVYRLGVKFSTLAASDTITLSSTTDGVTWTTVATLSASTLTTNYWYWFQLDPAAALATAFRITTTASSVVSAFVAAQGTQDLPMTPWNRDTYTAIPDKFRQGSPVTNWFFEKKLAPQITVWPTPNNSIDHFYVWRHRQVQDIGDLTQQIEIPNRWYEAITWHASFRVAVELPNNVVPQERLALCKQMADEFVIQVAKDEGDGMPWNLTPRIRGYTR